MKREHFEKTVFAERLKEARKNAEFSQAKLGELLNVSQDTVSVWERAKAAPDAEQLFDICRVLEISAGYLIGLTDY